jgi:membrane dipeptidase
MSRLDHLYEEGVRLITLMWNYENCLGYPNSLDMKIMRKGLKPFGIEVVKQMKEKKMLIDVSHSSDGGFWDAMTYARGYVVASHSNCRALCPHPRNLSDDMIRAMANAGGVAGLNLYGAFLDGSTESTLDAMVAHVKHMIKVGGSDFPAIGTDFDGFDGMTRLDVKDIGEMGNLLMALEKAGLTTGQIEKIWYGNVLRVIKETL